jgi:hypothetical protein
MHWTGARSAREDFASGAFRNSKDRRRKQRPSLVIEFSALVPPDGEQMIGQSLGGCRLIDLARSASS